MNSDNRDFWSKPRNRWMILVVSALSVGSGYVIASPSFQIPSLITFKHAEPLSTKVAEDLPTTVDEDISAPRAVVSTDIKIKPKDEKHNERINLTKIPEVKKTNSKTVSASSFEKEEFNPFSNPEMTNKERQSLRQELTSPAIDPPYDVSDEEMSLFEKYENGSITKDEQKKLIKYLGSFHPRVAVEKKQDKNNLISEQDNSNDQSGSPTAQKNSGGGHYYYPINSNSKSESSEAKELQKKSGTISKPELKYGVSDDQDLWYETYQRFELPPALSFTHENLKIYMFHEGTDAGIIPHTYSDVKNLYSVVSSKQEKSFHEQYRIPPDWSNRFRFDNDPAIEGKKAREMSNKLMYSLGTNGYMIFQVTKGAIYNGPGVDFIMWSNPFCYLRSDVADDEVKKDKKNRYPGYTPYAGTVATKLDENVVCEPEPAKVFVSSEGPNGPWKSIEPCYKGIEAVGSACTGYGYNLWFVDPGFNNILKGGDKYDLGKLENMDRIKAIKIQDLGNGGFYLQAGYDLDAIAMVNYEK